VQTGQNTHRAGPGPRVAIVHDYLTQRGGAERVVLSLCRAFPGAPVHVSLYDPTTTFPEFYDQDVRPMWLDRAAPLRQHHRLAIPFLPVVFSTERVHADVVICSSSGWAHGIRTDGRKVVYCHSPAKWLYRRNDYLGESPSATVGVGLRALDPVLRRFDNRAAASADLYVANSTFIASQVRAVYGIEAEVLFPPAGFAVNGPREPVPLLAPGYMLTVARLLPYKNVEQVVQAFRRLPRLSLVVVGDGPERARLVAGAPENVRFLGEVDDSTLRWLYENCAGLVTASREDFGLTPVEAAMLGKPVAALRWGGYLDTVVPDTTGIFFDRADPSAIAETVAALVERRWDPSAIKEHAATFSESGFINRIRSIVAQLTR